MSDLLVKIHHNRFSKKIAKAIGLPEPLELEREFEGYRTQSFQGKSVMLCGIDTSSIRNNLKEIVLKSGGELVIEHADKPINIVLMDATTCSCPEDYILLYKSFKPIIRRIAKNGRVLIISSLSENSDDPVKLTIAKGIEGFCRSLGKELGAKGITVNLAHVSSQAIDRLENVVRFFCGKQSTYVSGQVVKITNNVTAPTLLPFTNVLDGKVALVTGAARGIGLATAERLVQEGAKVICLDIPAMSDALNEVCSKIGAIPLLLDITALNAIQELIVFLKSQTNGLDVLVHNAGITRDKTLANMNQDAWESVINLNLKAIIEINDQLLKADLINDNGRIVCLSSISGIAGNFGQTNYATAKAALIGYVEAQAPLLASKGICINAVAPGFIETAMTNAMPFFTREIGKRLNSIKQGGKPRDVAELIMFLSSPGAYGISGNTIRVCGQGLIGS